MNKAVFLDRDGTINVEKNYLYKIEEFEFIDGAPEAIKLLNDNGYKVIVITNQAGIARGYYTEEDVEKLHKYVQIQLSKYEAHIDAFYYCPHHEKYGIGQYKVCCNCRKPKDGLLRKAMKKFQIDCSKSWVIGDKLSDVECGKKLNITGILVETGYGKIEKRNYKGFVNDNLFDAVVTILKKGDNYNENISGFKKIII